MTRLQQVLLQVETAYAGHPYFVSGNALWAALARRLDDASARALHVSTGVFVPGTHGGFLDEHAASGGAPYFGTSLPDVEAYEDLFLFRDPAQRWISETQPRDALNTHDIASYGGRTAVTPATRIARPATSAQRKATTNWYVQCYLHAAGSEVDVVPLDDAVLDGLRVGGARNFGLGETRLADTQVVDLDSLSFARVAAADAHHIELVSPYVLTTECPGADEQSVPWWWEPTTATAPATATETGTEAGSRTGTRIETDHGLRRRSSRLVRGGDTHALEVVDHGQVVRYTGSDPVRTARQGVLRVGTHAKYGFGEVRVRPATADRVPERGDASAQRGDA